MRRILLPTLLVLATLAVCTPAQARWGRHCGWGGGGWGGGWGGYRSCGWGGYSVGYRGYGWGGCYAPVYSYGCYPYVGYYNGCYGGNYYGRPFIGYYGYSPYNTYYNPQANFVAYSLPATTQPAELAYGPLAVKQFLGLNRNFALTNLNSPTLRVLTIATRPAAAATDIKSAVRVSNPEQRRKAEQYIALGDGLFREQKFHSALQKYKLAAQVAPDMAEAYWREGHAMIATSNFELASGAFKRAIALDADTRRGGFTLDKLYGPAKMAKTAHVEALASWALAHAESSNPYFLMGVTLAYDGQSERAAKFFARAADLAGVAGGHIAVFESAPAAVPAERKTPSVPVSAEIEI